MARKRRIFNAPFKAKVAIEAIKGHRTISELTGKHKLHATQINLWKRQLLEGAETIFENGDTSTLASVKVSEKSVEFTVPFESQGNTGTITVKAKVQEDGSLDGEWAITDSDGNECAREIWKATKN